MPLARADVLLVRSGLVRSRTEAQRLIEAGHVIARGLPGPIQALKPSTRLEDEVSFELTADPDRFASRGAIKLRHALDEFEIRVADRICLDAGQSSGGFTDYLLRAHAKTVVGVDVGHGQLVPELRDDDRVICIERVNLRDATTQSICQAITAGDSPDSAEQRHALSETVSTNGFDLICVDLSFISVRKVIGALATMLGSRADMVVLVKPQFELGPGAVNKHGVVRDPNAAQFLEQQFSDDRRADDGLTLCGWTASPITGGDGNQEYLIHLKPI